MHLGRALRGAPLVAVAFACARPGAAGPVGPSPAGRPGAVPSSRLPAIPTIRGPLALGVAYPAPGAVVDVGDSTFLLGTTGAGDAALTINGSPVRVWPNGAWIAWVALPPDSVARFELRASTPRDTASLVYQVRRARRFVPPDRPAWIDSTSLTPRGRVWVGADEYLVLTARAAPGAQVRLRLPNGTIVPLVPDPTRADPPEAVRAFEWDTVKLRTPEQADRYRGLIRGRTVGSDPGPVLPNAARVATDSSWQPAVLLAAAAGDTAALEWPLQIALLDSMPTVAVLDDDPNNQGGGDGITAGRSAIGATYAWFLPTGTRVRVTGRVNDELRVRLADGVEAWIPAADAQLLPPGTPPPSARAGALMITPAVDRVLARIPLGERVPYLIQEGHRRLAIHLYGTDGDIDWIRYGPAASDSLVRRVTWHHESGRVLRIDFELSEPVWGYRARWSDRDLILEIRRPPVVDGGEPLRGRTIAVDPGHPPAGATGPTGLREAEANLAVARVLARMLKGAGARVVLTRTADVPVELGARVPFADSLGAELFVSIHQNALPDGLDPFPNSGTSVFYNHPRSLPLARAIQRRLVERFGVRDLGAARADLAVTRGTWTPSVLVEGLHIIMPEHEAALRTAEGQELYARGVLEGIRDFLREARDQRRETR